MAYDSQKGGWRGNAQDAQDAAEQEGRTRSGAASRTKIVIEELTNDELREAATWPRFEEEWKQRLIAAEKARRGV